METILPIRRILKRQNSEQLTDKIDVTDQFSVWDLYNKKALQVDRELIQDWTGTLNNLLVFAALFSGILGAFCIESMKLLQEDHEEAAHNLLLFMVTQNYNATLNATLSPYHQTPFTIPPFAIQINCLFFASLTCSLFAAFSSVVVLQWIGRYDAGLANSITPKERALRRAFRFKGIKYWKMHEIIASLPYLIYLALSLFFIGLIIWLSNLHPYVGYVVLIVCCISATLYFMSILCTLAFSSAPYRTSLSDFLIGKFRFIEIVSGWVLLALVRAASSIAFALNSTVMAIWPQGPDTIDVYQREEASLKEIPRFDIRLQARLMNNLDIAPYSVKDLSIILHAFMNIDYDVYRGSQEIIQSVLWSQIFALLLNPFKGKILVKMADEERDEFLFLVTCCGCLMKRDHAETNLPIVEILRSVDSVSSFPNSTVLVSCSIIDPDPLSLRDLLKGLLTQGQETRLSIHKSVPTLLKHRLLLEYKKELLSQLGPFSESHMIYRILWPHGSKPGEVEMLPNAVLNTVWGITAEFINELMKDPIPVPESLTLDKLLDMFETSLPTLRHGTNLQYLSLNMMRFSIELVAQALTPTDVTRALKLAIRVVRALLSLNRDMFRVGSLFSDLMWAIQSVRQRFSTLEPTMPLFAKLGELFLNCMVLNWDHLEQEAAILNFISSLDYQLRMLDLGQYWSNKISAQKAISMELSLCISHIRNSCLSSSSKTDATVYPAKDLKSPSLRLIACSILSDQGGTAAGGYLGEDCANPLFQVAFEFWCRSLQSRLASTKRKVEKEEATIASVENISETPSVNELSPQWISLLGHFIQNLPLDYDLQLLHSPLSLCKPQEIMEIFKYPALIRFLTVFLHQRNSEEPLEWDFSSFPLPLEHMGVTADMIIRIEKEWNPSEVDVEIFLPIFIQFELVLDVDLLDRACTLLFDMMRFTEYLYKWGSVATKLVAKLRQQSNNNGSIDKLELLVQSLTKQRPQNSSSLPNIWALDLGITDRQFTSEFRTRNEWERAVAEIGF